MSCQNTKYYSRAIRIVEHDVKNKTFLEVKCDVVIEYKWLHLLTHLGSSRLVQADHEALLQAVKDEFESKQAQTNNVI